MAGNAITLQLSSIQWRTWPARRRACGEAPVAPVYIHAGASASRADLARGCMGTRTYTTTYCGSVHCERGASNGAGACLSTLILGPPDPSYVPWLGIAAALQQQVISAPAKPCSRYTACMQSRGRSRSLLRSSQSEQRASAPRCLVTRHVSCMASRASAGVGGFGGAAEPRAAAVARPHPVLRRGAAVRVGAG